MPWRTVLSDALPVECYSLSVLEVFSADRFPYLGFIVVVVLELPSANVVAVSMVNGKISIRDGQDCDQVIADGTTS